jgi:hypothetical protein
MSSEISIQKNRSRAAYRGAECTSDHRIHESVGEPPKRVRPFVHPLAQ